MQPSTRDAGHLWDMREAAEFARQFTSGMSYDEYLRDQMLPLATQQVLINAGRAAGRVSHEFRGAHPEIPWAELVAEQQALVEHYDEVDNERVWRLASERLPSLIATLEALIPPPPPDPEPDE